MAIVITEVVLVLMTLEPDTERDVLKTLRILPMLQRHISCMGHTMLMLKRKLRPPENSKD